MPEADDLLIRDFELDERNTRHLARHGATPEIVWEVWSDQPVVIPDKPHLSGSYLMIGVDSTDLLWTIAIVLIDDELALWRPITGFPTEREDERQAWHGES